MTTIYKAISVATPETTFFTGKAGRLIFSRQGERQPVRRIKCALSSWEIDAAMAEVHSAKGTEAIIEVPQFLIQQALKSGQSEAMISLEKQRSQLIAAQPYDRRFVPEETSELLEATGLGKEFRRFVEAIVISSSLYEGEGLRANWTRGFILEREEIADSPYRCVDAEAARLGSDGFLTTASPYRTVFLDGSELDPLGSFLATAYYLGYFSAKASLSPEQDPCNYEFKTFYAAVYELRAVRRLIEHYTGVSGGREQIRNIYECWLSPASDRMRAATAAFSEKYQMVAPSGPKFVAHDTYRRVVLSDVEKKR